MIRILRRGGVVFGVSALFASACLVDVDEGLLTKVNAEAGGVDANAESSDARPYFGMPCGAGSCQPPAQVCCAKTFGDPDFARGVCSTRDLCQTGDWFACESPRDCEASGLGVTQCCAQHDRGAFTTAKCATTCEATSAIICDPDGATCESPRRCLPSPEFPKLFECLAPP